MRGNLDEKLERASFVVDAEGRKKAVLLDYSTRQDLLNLPEDFEDSAEIEASRLGDEKPVSWEIAKAELGLNRYSMTGNALCNP